MHAKPGLQLKYEKEAVSEMQRLFGDENSLAVPKIVKAVVNVGLKQGLKDPKYIETAEQTLARITGQKPVKTLAKKSISNFKIRQGMVVGMMVTLRGKRMYDFLDKLVNVTLPRVRDFRGLSPDSVDDRGNLSIGFREYIAFPEIRPDEVERLHGLEIAIATTAKSREKGLVLFKTLGFPFREGK
jgi:large subunit ribosomal protein L5